MISEGPLRCSADRAPTVHWPCRCGTCARYAVRCLSRSGRGSHAVRRVGRACRHTRTSMSIYDVMVLHLFWFRTPLCRCGRTTEGRMRKCRIRIPRAILGTIFHSIVVRTTRLPVLVYVPRYPDYRTAMGVKRSEYHAPSIQASAIVSTSSAVCIPRYRSRIAHPAAPSLIPWHGRIQQLAGPESKPRSRLPAFSRYPAADIRTYLQVPRVQPPSLRPRSSIQHPTLGYPRSRFAGSDIDVGSRRLPVNISMAHRHCRTAARGRSAAAGAFRAISASYPDIQVLDLDARSGWRRAGPTNTPLGRPCSCAPAHLDSNCAP